MQNLSEIINDYEAPHRLGDGAYFSSKAPECYWTNKASTLEIDLSKDYFATPYETDKVFIWRGEEPLNISAQARGEFNHGCAAVIEVTKPGFITLCYEDD